MRKTKTKEKFKLVRRKQGLRPYRRGQGWALKRWQRVIGEKPWIDRDVFGWQFALIEVYKEMPGVGWWRQRAILEDLIDASFLVPLLYRTCLHWPVKEVLAEFYNCGTPELNEDRQKQNSFRERFSEPWQFSIQKVQGNLIVQYPSKP